MRTLLGQYGGKISWNSALRSPPDDNNMSGTGAADSSGAGDSGTGTGEGDASGTKTPKSEDDFDLSDLYSGDSEEELNKLNVPGEDKLNDGIESITESEKEANQALGTSIAGAIDSYKFSESDVPDDFDPTDKRSVANFMTSVHQKAVRHAISLTAPIITHALKTVIPKLEKRIENQVQRHGKVSEADKAFNSLGFTNPEDKALAKQFFERGLAKNMTHTAAASATRNAMKALGKSGATPKTGGQESPSTKFGADALDSMFN
jgi:hypothetical protein